MSKNEHQLFERLRNDDEVAFRIIYNNYTSKFATISFLEFIPLKDAAENIVQDTFCYAFGIDVRI